MPLIKQLDSFFRKCSWAIKCLVDPVSPDGNTFRNWLRHILRQQIFEIHEEAVDRKQASFLTWHDESQFHSEAGVDV